MIRAGGLYLMAATLFAAAPVIASPVHGDPLQELRSGFGRSVAIAGDYAFVGEASTGRGAGPAGIVHVYRRGPTGWKEVDKLVGPESIPGDAFGIAVASDGTTLLVSRTPPPPPQTGRIVNGEVKMDPIVPDTNVGIVYAYTRGTDGKWKSSGVVAQGAKASQLGVAIAVAGNMALIGMPGVPVDSSPGAVQVYRRSQNGDWSAEGTLPAQGLARGDRFGSAVAIDGERVVVGAPGRFHHGAIFVFHRAADGTWTQETEQVLPRNAPDNAGFGLAVAVKGDRVVAGAPSANFAVVQPVAGPPGTIPAAQAQTNATAAAARGPIGQFGAGMVLIFDRSKTGQWRTAGTLAPFDFGNDRFGASVAIVGDEIWIGAPTSGTVGRLYRARQDKDGEWTGMTKVAADSIDPQSQFGASFAVAGDVAIVGMPGDGGGAGTVAFMSKPAAGNWHVTGTSYPPSVDPYKAVAGKEVKCSEGKASDFECSNTGLLSYMPISAIGGKRGINLSGSWGWTDPVTGHDIAIIGRTDAAAFVDVTDPLHPRYLGDLARTKGANISSWREIKTYKNYALIVSDGSGDHHGIQFFDLTHLRGVLTPKHFTEDAHYDLGSIHDIVVNEGSGFAYAVGVNQSAENCGGGLHMVDIHDPLHPQFAGCFQDVGTGRSKTGYTHDAQCVMYHGPDKRYANHEICMASNETTVSIQDVTDKQHVKVLSHADYPTVGYTHQGWFTDDQKYFYLDDELDESGHLGKAADATRTMVFDMTDLEQPVLKKEFMGTTKAIDHNQYVKGNRLYQSDYSAGLRILDISDPENPREVGFLDTHPGSTATEFSGSWNNYPFFKNGAIGVVSIGEGFFLVKDRTTIVP